MKLVKGMMLDWMKEWYWSIADQTDNDKAWESSNIGAIKRQLNEGGLKERENREIVWQGDRRRFERQIKEGDWKERGDQTDGRKEY